MTGSSAASGPEFNGGSLPAPRLQPLTPDSSLTSALGALKAKALLKAFGFQTVNDLLSHYPRDYADREVLRPLNQLTPGANITVIADIVSVREKRMSSRPGTIVEVVISDGGGEFLLTFFGKSSQQWRLDQLRPGLRGSFSGKVTTFQNRSQLANPSYKTFESEEEEARDNPAVRLRHKPLIPIYAATAAETSWNLQTMIDQVLQRVGNLPDPVPQDMRIEHGLLNHTQAIRWIHSPDNPKQWKAAEETLRFTEAWVLQCALMQRHSLARERRTRPRVPTPGGYLERFDATLPFVLTVDQEICAAEIASDMARSGPMNRLLQGEVGSGKTVVALRAMLAVADSGGQTALLAPTEVLAAQHLRSITTLLGPDLAAELMPTLLTGKLPVAQKRKALLRTVSGQSRIVIGTHALLSDTVTFFDLGLIVIDEQHRFGVDQRETLRLKGAQPPHVLVMTATPIPRTIAMTVFGDLDVSTIRMLPSGRQGIRSVVVPMGENGALFGRVWASLAQELALGRQGFVVCPAISPAEIEEVPADLVGIEPSHGEKAGPLFNVEEVLEGMHGVPTLAPYRLEALHGRMTSDEKDRIMRSFAAGEIDVLVATTVIEVGVDVPNASAMVVLDADRFGVSQLHQLRGRVGRGSVPGLCLLVTNSRAGSPARQRIGDVAATLDGFVLAELDLALRREGNVLGDLQSGDGSKLRFLRVAVDGDLIAEVRRAAFHLVTGDPGIRTNEALRNAIARRLNDSERSWLNKG
ncbi:ATP-dependent DNA helicase RecG [Cryobacterium sp. TMT1-66-1]|uniref:ATP-dependent DNA helicase RecG n=1 Tax=Cryobacterium sp. TMT1-66-1 TaxID=1259242 RepID=UPI00106D7DF4|nr:ATP-dependent DNA helicase RecG [Cryobacterium sp. TMT1-66-1]TFD08137.1 ATP-dependent DNA helicase RecG [Cryobacterium sp. TMT1-66-1]